MNFFAPAPESLRNNLIPILMYFGKIEHFQWLSTARFSSPKLVNWLITATVIVFPCRWQLILKEEIFIFHLIQICKQITLFIRNPPQISKKAVPFYSFLCICHFDPPYKSNISQNVYTLVPYYISWYEIKIAARVTFLYRTWPCARVKSLIDQFIPLTTNPSVWLVMYWWRLFSIQEC